MRELTQHELTATSGAIGPAGAVLAVVLATAGAYGAGKSIYEFGKALGQSLVTPDEPSLQTQ